MVFMFVIKPFAQLSLKIIMSFKLKKTKGLVKLKIYGHQVRRVGAGSHSG